MLHYILRQSVKAEFGKSYILGGLDQAELRGALGEQCFKLQPSLIVRGLQLLEVLQPIHSLFEHAVCSFTTLLCCSRLFAHLFKFISL